MFILKKQIIVYIFLIHIAVIVISCSSRLLSPKLTPPKVTTSSSLDKPVLLSVNYLSAMNNIGLIRPVGITLDTEGNIYVADAGHHRVIVYSKNLDKREEMGRFGWRLGEFNNPTDLGFYAGQNAALFIADSGNNRVLTCFLGDQFFRPVAQIDLENPLGVAVDRKGNVYIADTDNNRILKIGENGSVLMEEGGYGWARTQFNKPTDLVIDKRGNIYVVDSGNKRIKKYDFSGNVSAIWSHPQFAVPYGICLDKFGNVFVTDLVNRSIYVFDGNGKQLTEFTEADLQEPAGIAIENDIVYVTDTSAGNIKVFRIVYRNLLHRSKDSN